MKTRMARALRPLVLILLLASLSAAVHAEEASSAEGVSIWRLATYKTIAFEAAANTADIALFAMFIGGSAATAASFSPSTPRPRRPPTTATKSRGASTDRSSTPSRRPASRSRRPSPIASSASRETWRWEVPSAAASPPPLPSRRPARRSTRPSTWRTKPCGPDMARARSAEWWDCAIAPWAACCHPDGRFDARWGRSEWRRKLPGSFA